MTLIGSILVASDLTRGSDAVVAAAAGLAAARGAELHILHAFDFPSGATRVGSGPSPASFQERIARSEGELDRQVERVVAPTGARVASRRVEIFVAHRAIAEAARAVRADLIVFGAHSHRRIGDEILGSTADKVIRSSEVPCLVVRAPLALPLRSVVAPVDRSPAALGALEVAMQWADGLGVEGGEKTLTVVHVLPRALDLPEFSLDPDAIGTELHDQVAEARRRSGAPADMEVREEIRWGDDAVDEIVAYARERRVDLLVIGTHGHGPLKRFLIGSVASGVARRAPCPVLLVPPSRWEGDSGADVDPGGVTPET